MIIIKGDHFGGNKLELIELLKAYQEIRMKEC